MLPIDEGLVSRDDFVTILKNKKGKSEEKARNIWYQLKSNGHTVERNGVHYLRADFLDRRLASMRGPYTKSSTPKPNTRPTIQTGPPRVPVDDPLITLSQFEMNLLILVAKRRDMTMAQLTNKILKDFLDEIIDSIA